MLCENQTMERSPDEQRATGTWQVSAWVVDLDRRRVTRAGETLALPDLTFRLLAALLAAAPETVSGDALLDAVWGRTVVSDETLKQRVMLLRRALGEGGEELVLTDRGRGYRLAEPPRPITEPAPGGRSRKRAAAVAAMLAAALAAGVVLFRPWIGGAVNAGPVRATGEAGAPTARWVAVQLDEIRYLSPPQDADRFVEGLQEALLSQLANLEGVRVHRGGAAIPERAARELGLAARLEISGSYRQAGYQARVAVRVADLKTGQVLFAREFDADVSRYERLDAQRHIAEATARAVAEQVAVLVASD